MRISERVDIAVRAVASIAAADTEIVKADSIASAQDLSLAYLLDILRDLKRAELLRSRRGPDGGFSLSRPADEITLADIFRAIDGPLADVHDTSLRNLQYRPPTESLTVIWMAVRGSLRQVLEAVTIADLISGELPTAVADLAEQYRRATGS